MKTNPICPISTYKIDENIARLNATFTVLLLFLFAFTQNLIPILLLIFDFTLRGFEFPKYSPLATLSKKILKTFNAKSKPINAGPKIFAARIGILFSVIIIVSSFFELQTLSLVFAGIFGICAFLEAAFGFCVACQIFPFVYKLMYQSKIEKIKI